MRGLIVLLLIAMLISGCAAQKIGWMKSDGNEAQFKRDNFECLQASRTSWSGGGSGLMGIAMMAASSSSAQSSADKIYKMCMESKGYCEKEK